MSEPPAYKPGADSVLINGDVAHAARVYDYLLGGIDNFAADREAAEQQAAVFGGMDKARAGVRANRDFLVRAVRYLALEAGVRQFLDLGTGIPNADNVHAVAQQAAPDARIVYVDNDPVVLAHAHDLLDGSPAGAAAYIHGDLREPEPIVEQAVTTLDFSKPVAVLLIAVLHLVPDEDDPYGIVTRLLNTMPSGSYLGISHMTKDVATEEMTRLEQSVPDSARYRFVMRSHAEVCALFDGLELVEPGIVTLDQWRPGAGELTPAHHYGGLGRKH